MKNFILRFFVAISAFVCVCASVEAQTRAETFAITNAQIATVSGPVISRGTVVVRDGLIESVGENARVPADARVIDGSGLTIYPGFIDAYTSLGLATQTPRPPQAGNQPQTQANQPQSNSNYPEGLRPEEKVFEQLKAGDAQFEANRNAGFTTVVTVGRDGIFNGQSAIINLAGNSVSEMIVLQPFAQHVTMTTVRGGGFPTSLMGTFSALKQMFLDAARYQDIKKTYEKNPRGIQRPANDLSLEAIVPVINREIPIVFNANTEIEIVRILDLAKEFNLRAIIAGGQEAWKVAPRLKAQNVPVLLSLNFPKRTAAAAPEADPEPLEILRLRAETPKTASRLQQAGVKFAFQSGGMQNIGDFLANAAKAIENGLDKNAAARAMTLSAAEILGVDNRLGSIEAGKIANLTVSRGDIFAKDKTITHVVIDGKLFEQKEKPKTAAPTNQPTALQNVGGVYNITIEIPGQPMQGTLNFTQQEAILSGTVQTQLGTTTIKDGRVTADGFSFTTSVEFGGSTVELAVSGKVIGNQISGTMTSPQGAIAFSGTKVP